MYKISFRVGEKLNETRLQKHEKPSRNFSGFIYCYRGFCRLELIQDLNFISLMKKQKKIFWLRCSTCPLVFVLLGVESRDFSHAEKERTACKAEQTHKMTTIFTQNDILGPFWLKICHFFNLLIFAISSFFLSMRKIT